nr:helix-turn-helix domain-containing protein [Roseibium aggregatum]
MARGDLTDAEWDLIEALLPSERGRKSRPAQDNRRYLNGMLHVLRVGCPWRNMHGRPPAITDDRWPGIRQMLDSGMTIAAAARTAGVPRQAVYRRLQADAKAD